MRTIPDGLVQAVFWVFIVCADTRVVVDNLARPIAVYGRYASRDARHVGEWITFDKL